TCAPPRTNLLQTARPWHAKSVPSYMTPKQIMIYDTTLRDGTQAEGISFSDRAACTLRFRRGDSSTYQNRPKVKLSTAVLLPTEDLDWSAPRRDYPTDMLLHQLFETQAAKTPEATAVVYEDQTLSYRQLDQAADALACRLQAA